MNIVHIALKKQALCLLFLDFEFIKGGEFVALIVKQTLVCPLVQSGLPFLSYIFLSFGGRPTDALTGKPQRLPIAHSTQSVFLGKCKKISHVPLLSFGGERIFLGGFKGRHGVVVYDKAGALS